MKFIIDQTFQIEGRGCILTIKNDVYKPEEALKVGDLIVIEKEDGSLLQTKILGVEQIKKFHNAPKTHPGILVGPELTNKDIPLKSKLYKLT